MAQQLYVRDPAIADVIHGPFTSKQLKLLAGEGRVQPTHQVSLDKNVWVAATKVTPSLFPQQNDTDDKDHEVHGRVQEFDDFLDKFSNDQAKKKPEHTGPAATDKRGPRPEASPSTTTRRSNIEQQSSRTERVDFADQPGWKNVLKGLSILSAGVQCSALSALLLLLTGFFTKSPWGGTALGLGELVTMVGQVWCLAVPRESGLRRFVVLAAACVPISILFAFLAMILLIDADESKADTIQTCLFLAFSATGVRHVFFLLFLRRLAQLRGDESALKAIFASWFLIGGIVAAGVVSSSLQLVILAVFLFVYGAYAIHPTHEDIKACLPEQEPANKASAH